MRQIYVLRSADEKCTKIGMSYNVNYRVDSICLTERKKYYLVYHSIPLEDDAAKEIERKIKERFKDETVKGKEWLSTHPLEVIRYIVNDLKIPYNKKNLAFSDIKSNYDYWVASLNDYDSLTYEQPNTVRINTRYEAFVKFIYNAQRVVIGFANIGDANNFAQEYKHNISVMPIITQLLYGMTHEEWKNKLFKQSNHANWALI